MTITFTVTLFGQKRIPIASFTDDAYNIVAELRDLPREMVEQLCVIKVERCFIYDTTFGISNALPAKTYRFSGATYCSDKAVAELFPLCADTGEVFHEILHADKPLDVLGDYFFAALLVLCPDSNDGRTLGELYSDYIRGVVDHYRTQGLLCEVQENGDKV